MKKTFLTLAIVLLAMATFAQTAFKVHSNGQISLQSATTSDGIQIPSSGIMSIEPNVTTAYGMTALTKTFVPLARAWGVKLYNNHSLLDYNFFVQGNGNVYASGGYYIYTTPPNPSKGSLPIIGATELVSSMNGYYMDSHEFDDVTPEDFIDNPNVLPEALEGLLSDLQKDKVVGMDAEELEEVLPEAVRHDCEGNMAINYSAIVPVLIEAFKEQQARIEQLESILRENRLLK